MKEEEPDEAHGKCTNTEKQEEMAGVVFKRH